MNINLNVEIMKQVDVMSAVIFAVAESAGVFPGTVRDISMAFPYADKKTIRNKLNTLTELGFLNRFEVPSGSSESLIHIFEKKKTPSY